MSEGWAVGVNGREGGGVRLDGGGDEWHSNIPGTRRG